jgi:hypothetical protein
MTTTDDTRKFLIDDISALLNQNKSHEWLDSVNDSGLYELWRDLVNLRTSEAVYEVR